jgi:hypothetical protein
MCLPLLKNGRKLVFLCFTIVDPKALVLTHLSRCRIQNLERNAMRNFKGLTVKIQRGGGV